MIKIFGCASLRAVVFLVNEPVLSTGLLFLLRHVHGLPKRLSASSCLSVHPSVLLNRTTQFPFDGFS